MTAETRMSANLRRIMRNAAEQGRVQSGEIRSAIVRYFDAKMAGRHVDARR